MGIGACWKVAATTLDCIRVVHVSGFVEDFDGPLTVAQLVAMTPKHFVCTPAHLLSFGTHPLGLQACLLPGRVYFLLPHSIFHSDSSPVDLVTLATRLSAIAKRAGPSTSRSKVAWTGAGFSPVVAPTSPDLTCRLGRMTYKESSWKPILESIEERMSMERR